MQGSRARAATGQGHVHAAGKLGGQRHFGKAGQPGFHQLLDGFARAVGSHAYRRSIRRWDSAEQLHQLGRPALLAQIARLRETDLRLALKARDLGGELRAQTFERTNEILARPCSFASHGGRRRLGRLRGFDDLLEGVRIADGQIRQDLAIDGDVGFGHAGDELGEEMPTSREARPLSAR